MDIEPHELSSDDRQLLDTAWDLFDEGDLQGARTTLTSLSDQGQEQPDTLELVGELALADDDPGAALNAYLRWNEIAPDDPEPWIASAEVYLEYFDDAHEATRLMRGLLAGPELDSVDEADARHLLGLACEARNDRRGMVREWLAVLRLDALNDSAEPILTRTNFEAVAAAALEELPDEVVERLRNVPILVEDRPPEALVLEGLDPRTLGVFHGIAMPDQLSLGPGPDAGLIHLFQRNLERESFDDDDLAEQIRITVLHETAHYFGASEEDLKRFGLN
ncbi:MAG: metallopeptidase family protein [Thermoleophilia bacterium]